MKFGRDKRLLLGLLAAIAPLPLPFNDVVGWASLAGFWLAVALFMRRAAADVGGWLPNWAMNLLAIAYLPVFALDLGVLWRGRILQPVVHLLLFALAIKLFALKREKDKWQALVVIFFLFLAAAGTSVHPSVVLYIIAFLAGVLLLLARFVTFDMLAHHPRRAPEREHVPLRGFVVGGVLFAIIVAIPLFVFLPRLRSPYVTGPGGGYGGLTQIASFQEVMRLDGIGRVRGNRAVVMRLSYDSPPPPAHERRLKVATYDRFQNDQWSRRNRRPMERYRSITRQPDGYYPLGREEPVSWMAIWLQPFSGRFLGVPVDAVELELMPSALDDFISGATGPSIVIDDSGVVQLPRSGPGLVRYRVGLMSRPRIAVTSPLLKPDLRGALDLGGVTPRITEFASQVMGEGAAGERALRAERHLSETFEYTIDLIGSPQGEGIETFLFTNRRGHCELFASSMVLMLRSQGIPARLATGFLGADYNPIEAYYMVRESNAHAWVEAFVDGAGWVVFDPTPAAGLPVSTDGGLSALAAQLYDYLIFRWDRYVLTFGLSDQVGFMASLRELWLNVSSWWRSDEAAAQAPANPVAPGPLPLAPEVEPEADMRPMPWWPLTSVLLVATAVFLWFQRRRFTATLAYVRLRERLRSTHGQGLEAVAPLSVAALYAADFPAAAQPARELIELYLRESFAGRQLSAEELGQARALLKQALSRRAA